MPTRLIELILFICTLLTGFYAGIGFFGIIGFMPGLEKMSDSAFAESWQHLDHFMAARMKIFGPILLLTLLSGVIVLLKEYRTPSFWLILVAFGIMVSDVIFSLSTNHPLNQLIQSWDLKNLPGNVGDIKWRVIKAFGVRDIFMIATFTMVLLAVFLRKSN